MKFSTIRIYLFFQLVIFIFSNPLSAQVERLPSGRPFISEAKIKDTTKTLSLKIKKPKTAKGTALNKLVFSGCWTTQGLKSVKTEDANGKAVKFKLNKNDERFELTKLHGIKFPIKIKLNFKSARKIEQKGGTFFAYSSAVCKKSKKKGVKVKCDPTQFETASSFTGITCDGPSDFEPLDSQMKIVLSSGDNFDIFPKSGDLKFTTVNGTFLPDIKDASVSVNKKSYSSDKLKFENNTITLTGALEDGLNKVEISALDSLGFQAHESFNLWAGSKNLFVQVVDTNSQLLQANVTLTLAEDKKISKTVPSTAGVAQFTNVPLTTVLLNATTADGLSGFAAVSGDSGTVQLKLTPFMEPTIITNNIITPGLTGWVLGKAPVKVVEHVENIPSPSTPLAVIGGAGTGVDYDLELNTSGEGTQKISRTFKLSPDTGAVTVRYHFQTDEFPGGYFGTKYNDYYSIQMRSRSGKNLINEGNNMNALGQGAFNPDGSTAWKESTMTIDKKSSNGTSDEEIQIDISVANVADGYYDSKVVVDVIEEKSFSIIQQQLDDIDNSSLSYISGENHTYFSGYTNINGTISFQGTKEDSVKTLELQFLEGTSVKATAEISPAAKTEIIGKKFGESKRLEITSPILLFRLPAGQADSLRAETNKSYTPRIRAVSEKGEEVTADAGPVSLLVLLDSASRYGGRDAAVGGDDWIKPTVNKTANDFAGLSYGDISNMNGGSFPPHAGHTNGAEIDAWFSGYNALDATTANTLINLLNSVPGAKITRIWVTFSKIDTDPFWQAIKDKTLTNGTNVSDIIQPHSGHGTHFHMNISE